MTVVANIDLPIREDSTPWAAGTGSLTPTEKETLAQSGILTQDWSSDPALTPDETAELRSKQPTLTYMLGGSGIAFIKPGSYTAGNNGVLTLGTAFAVVYTWGAYFYVPASGIYSGSAAGWYWGVMSSSSSVTLYNNKYTSGTPAIPGTPTPFVTTGSGAVTSSLLEIPGPRYTLAAGALGINGTLLMQGRVYGTANSNNKYVRPYMGSALMGQWQGGTNYMGELHRSITNCGSYTRQSMHSWFVYPGVIAQTPMWATENTGVNVTCQITLTTAVATDNIAIVAHQFVVYPFNA